MKKILVLFLLSLFIFSGCGSQDLLSNYKNEDNYIEKTFNFNSSPVLQIDAETAKVYCYTWEKKSVKVEIKSSKKISEDNESNADNIADDLDVKVVGKDVLDIKKKNKSDIKYEITIYHPKDIKRLQINSVDGELDMYDGFKGEIFAKGENFDINIKKITGKVDIELEKGSVDIGEGTIEPGSNIMLDKGNINVQAEIADYNSCKFKTNLGYLTL